MLNPEVIRLIVSLGNPGREYAATRHNVGFLLVDQLARQNGAVLRPEKVWQAELAKAGAVWLCKPLTYMNRSGDAVRLVSDFYKIAPAQTLVVLDDMALPLGKLRLRPGGSAGGHHGLQSIIDHLGTVQIPRLRVGIGAADSGAAVSHVLGRFSLEEQAGIEQSVERALAAIDLIQREGLAPAMNLFN